MRLRVLLAALVVAALALATLGLLLGAARRISSLRRPRLVLDF